MFDFRHEICRNLLIYQMVPAPAIPGDKYLNSKDRDTWARTSIERRFAPGEGAPPEQRSFLKRIDRRVREEFRAVKSGSRYTFVSFG
jgi:hypothetical protein